MNKITPIALIVTGGLSAQAANAAIVVQTFDALPGASGYDVTIGNAAGPQYRYTNIVKPFGSINFNVLETVGNSQIASIADASTLPTAQSTFTSNSSFKPSAYDGNGFGPNFVGLKFNIGTGSHYGIANFALNDDGAMALTTVSYDDVAIPGAVPEPESWALLIGGFGVAGAALRREKLATA
jgi:hypothetical protein